MRLISNSGFARCHCSFRVGGWEVGKVNGINTWHGLSSSLLLYVIDRLRTQENVSKKSVKFYLFCITWADERENKEKKNK